MSLGRTLAKSPLFKQYEWHILACSLGLLLCWIAVEVYRDRRSWSKALRSDFERATAKLATVWIAARARAAVVVPPRLRIPLVVSIAALLIAAFGEPPYDFFVLMRVLLFVVCLVAMAALQKSNPGTSWVWTLAVIALLYNPLLPIHLRRDTWRLLNLATVPILGFLCLASGPSGNSS